MQTSQNFLIKFIRVEQEHETEFFETIFQLKRSRYLLFRICVHWCFNGL